MNKPIISVILLTYKKFHFFEKCIDSVLNQTYPNIELIISDDGSDNFDLEYIESYINQNKKDNITNINIIHHNNNVGTVKNYNNAIKVSKGKYLINLAIDDCFYNSQVIDNIVKFFIQKKALIVTAYREVYDIDLLNKIETLPKEENVKVLESNKNIYRKLCINNFISGACTYYSKEFFNKFGLFDERYILLEDYPKYLYATRNKCRIEFLNKPTIKYRVGGISNSSIINPLLKSDYEKAILNEILPYKKDSGILTNRIKKFEYLKMTKEKHICRLVVMFPDIVLLKTVFKMKSKKLPKF